MLVWYFCALSEKHMDGTSGICDEIEQRDGQSGAEIEIGMSSDRKTVSNFIVDS